jgi:hypothetical protein
MMRMPRHRRLTIVGTDSFSENESRFKIQNNSVLFGSSDSFLLRRPGAARRLVTLIALAKKIEDFSAG